MPEVNQVVRLHRRDAWIKYQDRVSEQIFCLADEELMEMFHFPVHTGGQAQWVLREPGSILVTQSAAQKFFGSENPIGQVLSVENYLFGGEYRVAGVLEDIPHTSTIFFDFLISPQSLRNEFRYWDTIFGVFSFIAIFVACLGLVGLSAFVIQLRTREIGVRKVLGASVSSIVLLLFNEFSKLIIASNLIALPIAFYLLGRWLESYPYRIQLGIEPFLLSGIITVVVSFTTISFHAFRAATTNPINALRTE